MHRKHNTPGPPVWWKSINIYSSYCSETKIRACLGQITSSKIDEICPLAIPNQISTISMHIPSLAKIHWYLCPHQTCLVAAILDSLWLSRPVPSHLNIAYNFGYLWWIALQFGTHTHCSKTQWGDNLDNSCRHFAWIMAPFWLRNCLIQIHFNS